MRIDVHAHYWTEDYLDLLADLGKADAGAARSLGAGGGAELEARLGLMDRAGVEMQVLSACPQLPCGEDAQKAVRAARFVNDQYADLAQRRRDRFRGFAALPMPHVEESVGEMGRALDELGMAGVAMNTTVLGRALVEPDFKPVFAELNRRGAVLYLHPAGNRACSPLIGNYHLTWMVGAPVEDTISVMHLITHGIPARYPDVKIINSHLGGALPMLLQRADDQYRWEAPDTPERPSVAARRMWYDTVGHGHVPALRCAIDSLGADRLLLGTDFPYENGDIFVRAVDYINDPQIDTIAARAILDQNANALFGIGQERQETASSPVRTGDPPSNPASLASTDRDVPSAVREMAHGTADQLLRLPRVRQLIAGSPHLPFLGRSRAQSADLGPAASRLSRPSPSTATAGLLGTGFNTGGLLAQPTVPAVLARNSPGREPTWALTR
jgi:aminocarboxymuconate-semialdehyde decarboxylase